MSELMSVLYFANVDLELREPLTLGSKYRFLACTKAIVVVCWICLTLIRIDKRQAETTTLVVAKALGTNSKYFSCETAGQLDFEQKSLLASIQSILLELQLHADRRL